MTETAKLPCDVQIAHITFRKGTKLATLVAAAARWHADAERLWKLEHPTDEDKANDIMRRLNERRMPGNSRLRIMREAEELNFLFKHKRTKK